MKWEERLSRWLGSQIEVHIEDQAGLDPVAPSHKMTLTKIRMSENEDYVQMYMNDHQFLSIPLRGKGHTSLTSTEEGTILRSSDMTAQLVYKVRFGL
ncbi:hypothetical protein ACFPES_08665 [Paenibacillus sp. GCM10023248]|uniref:hypothetical protein n=1 Tax=unclassified Paenibacillus TaxID=185978 RepID=UPI002378A362|nr:hypothetical protein [Paenibacillus sp. MAHUQ-63]MDD9267092.1 hypothetical protein [Paenibacillus sp. MAHUQ-63]